MRCRNSSSSLRLRKWSRTTAVRGALLNPVCWEHRAAGAMASQNESIPASFRAVCRARRTPQACFQHPEPPAVVGESHSPRTPRPPAGCILFVPVPPPVAIARVCASSSTSSRSMAGSCCASRCRSKTVLALACQGRYKYHYGPCSPPALRRVVHEVPTGVMQKVPWYRATARRATRQRHIRHIPLQGNGPRRHSPLMGNALRRRWSKSACGMFISCPG
jgi:hypothetical protein